MGSPLPTPQNAITAASIQNSVNSLAQAQFNNMVTTRLLGSLLLGANEQVSGCDCGGGFAGVGSFALGSHGRWALTDNLTLLAGASWDSFYQDGTNVSASPIVAASLRYDPSNWGTSRPFLEFGAVAFALHQRELHPLLQQWVSSQRRASDLQSIGGSRSSVVLAGWPG